ncbi:gamma-glutamylcyclotransferase [Alkalihalobacillus sp. AL-G]|nr:gamma-glutamylcyclotransferase family protein [Alkalihalobacillus sp. AL-G]WLD94240.1 gamma-glutamylcyclotransferase [Alkalihalobacillus sp. AL-G]
MNCVAECAWIQAALYDTGNGYPAVILSEKGTVYGELYDVNPSELQKLDRLEGYEGAGGVNLYERKILLVQTEEAVYNAYVYTADHNLELCENRIPTGDWIHQSPG